MIRSLILLFSLALVLSASAVRALERRTVATVGEIVRAAGDEEIRFVSGFSWRPAQATQQVAAGDALRTGSYGHLALLLQDETQLRVHPDSYLVVEEVRSEEPSAKTLIRLAVGSLWARAQRALRATPVVEPGATEPVRINTPVVAIGIRGTDWFVRVDPNGRSTLITLSGVAVMSNDLGSVSVSSGEIAVTEKGKAPVKRVIADLVDRPLLALEYRFGWRELLRLHPAQEAAQAQVGEPLLRALQLYDNGHLSAAGQALNELTAPPPHASQQHWADLLRAMLALRAGNDDTAQPLLERIRSDASGQPALLAALALTGLAMDDSDYHRAERALAMIESRSSPAPIIEIFSLALMFMRDDYEAAIARARSAESQFPDDSRLSALRAGFHLLTGDTAAMAEASQRAVTVDPNDPIAWHVRGVYFQYAALDADSASEAYQRALSLNSQLAESWNNLALLRLELGQLAEALDAARQAVEVRPNSALTKANLAGVLMILDELDEASTYTAAAAKQDPTHPQVLAGQGFQWLYRGDNDEAVREFNRAVAADPTFPGVQTNLAIAQYQSGDFNAARQAIDNAVRMDPDDPVAALVGSTMALDQSRIGDAVRFARRGLDNALRFGTYAVESLANTQSGIMSVGAAYAALGLGEWGDYYAQRVFDPYLAQSYSFLAGRYGSSRTRQGAAGQGLLLDPTGVSSPSRYFQFLRQPHYDLSASFGYGNEGGSRSFSGSVTASGHLRAPAPTSYALSLSANDAEGVRINSDSRGYSLLAAVGVRSNQRKDSFVFALSSSRTVDGIPGILGDEDEDDGSNIQSTFASLGYQRRLGYSNRIFARIGLGRSNFESTNPRPFGTGLSDLEFSLIQTFGLDAARALLSGGTFDATAALGFPTDPVLLTDPVFGPALGFEAISTLPSRVDFNPISSISTRTEQLDVQFRHLFDVKGAHVTYGGEWMPRRQRSRTEAVLFDPQGTGLLVPDLLAFPAGASAFLFGGTSPLSFTTESSPTGGQAYAQVSRNFGDSVLAEGGVFARYVDDGARDLWQFDPRAGLAWRPTPGHWLRMAYQRELGHPGALNGTLAPVSTVGLVIPDDLVLLDGATVRDYRARWDAEWTRNLFTFVSLSHQNQDQVLTSIPQTSDALVSGESEISSVRVGLNTWFFEEFGLSATHRVNRTRIIAPTNRGERLGLIPRSTTSIAVNWIHPQDVRLSAVVTRVGQRYADNRGTTSLSPYWTTGVSASWQFMKRHGAVSLSLANLFDRHFQLAAGVPGPGRAALFTVTARY